MARPAPLAGVGARVQPTAPRRDPVTYRNFFLNSNEYSDELQQMFEGRGRPIDVIGGDDIWPAEFAENGWIADLSSRFTQSERQQFLPGTIQANTYQGKVWGVPLLTDVALLFYRKDLLDQSGFFSPPQTWDELKQMALQVKQDASIQHGYVFQGAEYEDGVCNGLEYIWTHGGDVLDSRTPTGDHRQPPDGGGPYEGAEHDHSRRIPAGCGQLHGV
jgi:multiple sugar transport system substrate-binding protein